MKQPRFEHPPQGREIRALETPALQDLFVWLTVQRLAVPDKDDASAPDCARRSELSIAWAEAYCELHRRRFLPQV